MNYSQDAFERYGLGQHIVSRWENGKYPRGLDWLAVMARDYDTSADYLLGLTDDPAPASTRRLPPYGADVLGILRELPPEYAEQVLQHALIVRQAYEDAAWLGMVAQAIELVGANTVNEIALTLRDVAKRDGLPAAVEYFKTAYAALAASLNEEVAEDDV